MAVPTIPTVVTAAGLQPTPPATLRDQLIAAVAAAVPGYTANLPGSLIEDIASTDTAALALMDAARVDLVNSLTPYGANEFLLNQLGQIYGVQPGASTNTSVYVVFSGTVGFVVPQGFTVSDGTYQYTVQSGGVIASGGDSETLFCVATQSGTWAVPANTVTTLITSVPGAITLSVTNPSTGTPSAGAQTVEQYRANVLQSGLAAAQGMGRFLKTQLVAVPGVQPRLVSVRQVSAGWQVLCGGGDPYEVANAIFMGLFDISSLQGSVIEVTALTNANPGVITTNLNHGFTTGQNDVYIAGVVGTSGVNGGPYTVTVVSEKTFSFGVNTTAGGAYVSGGVVTPNDRNVSVDIQDYPDTYTIPFINPPQQDVTVQLTWNTSSPNFVSDTAVAQVGAPALANYINSIPVGAPINLFELQNVFQVAVVSAGLDQIQYLTRMVFTVSINGISTPPDSGTGIIAGDPESFFQTTTSDILITQG
jgi:hypothetical protein